MKISIKNLGPLKQAEFELGELTIICGENNTGKTYATYALYGFLKSWQDNLSIHVPEEDIHTLLNDGTVELNIQDYIDKGQMIINKGCDVFTKRLSQVFAATEKYFQKSQFVVILDSSDIQPLPTFDVKMGTAKESLFSISKKADSLVLTISFLVGSERVKLSHEFLSTLLENHLKYIIFWETFHNTHIVSAERTAAAVFRTELQFTRNKLVEEMQSENRDINQLTIQHQLYSNYAWPVMDNFTFTRHLADIAKNDSFIAKEHPDILSEFSDIVGGSYRIAEPDMLYFIPKGKNVKLTMGESSSSVRSLLVLAFYLSHVATKGDLLMIDEPELNLHPESQRRMARLFSRLVNIGIKVFITTHSDYIIKELNTLIMLNQDDMRLKELAEREGYKVVELLNADKVKVYIAENSTLVPADIDPQDGIEVTSFDKSIDDMNRIQEGIVWGGDE